MIAISIAMMFILEMFYFFKTYNLTQSSAKAYMESIINQVEEKLVDSSEQISELAKLLAYNEIVQNYFNEENILEKHKQRYNVEDIMEYASSSNKLISSIFIIDVSGDTVKKDLTGFADVDLLETIKSNYKVTVPQNNNNDFTGVLKNKMDNKYYYAYIYSANNMLVGNMKSKIATCIVVVETTYLKQIIDSILLSDNSLFLIIDNNNQVVASNKSDMIGTQVNEDIVSLLNTPERQIIKNIAGNKSIVQYKPVDEMNWKIVSIIPLKEISDDLVPIRNTGLIIGIALVIVLVIVGHVFLNNISKPISQIVNFLNSVGLNRLNKRIEIYHMNEIGLLSLNINKMLDEIKLMTKNIVTTQASLYEAELAKKQAELSALQSQINPHFLYNTLDCLQGIGYSYKSPEIINITESLSKILRYSIKGSNIVLVKDEISCIKNYLNIIAIRFSNKYTYELDIEQNLLNEKMIKLILQPIVENAVYHGLERKEGNGHIIVKGWYEQNNIIYFEISDNGKGMSAGELDNLNARLSQKISKSILESENMNIGLFNINDRIKYYYGDKYGIKLFSKEGEGTKVVIRIPTKAEN